MILPLLVKTIALLILIEPPFSLGGSLPGPSKIIDQCMDVLPVDQGKMTPDEIEDRLKVISSALFRFPNFSLWMPRPNLAINSKGEFIYYSYGSKLVYIGNVTALEIPGVDWGKTDRFNMDGIYHNISVLFRDKNATFEVNLSQMREVLPSELNADKEDSRISTEVPQQENPLEIAVVNGRTITVGSKPYSSVYRTIHWGSFLNQVVDVSFGNSGNVLQLVQDVGELSSKNFAVEKGLKVLFEFREPTSHGLTETGIWIFDTSEGIFLSKVVHDTLLAQLSVEKVVDAFNGMVAEVTNHLAEDSDIRHIYFVHSHPMANAPLSPADKAFAHALFNHALFRDNRDELDVMAVAQDHNRPGKRLIFSIRGQEAKRF